MAAVPPPQFPTLKFPITELLPRIHAEYLEMLGLNRTTPQGRWLGGWMARRARLCRRSTFAHARGLGLGRHESYAVDDVRQRDMNENDDATSIRGAGRVSWLIGTNDGY